jgi:general secretion pathway protein E
MNAKDAAGAHRRPGHDSHRPHGQPPAVLNGRVTGGYVVKQLVADGLLSASDAERFSQSGGRERAGHPLAVLAEMNYRSPQADRRLLDLETLTQWLAGKAGLPYFHIDPLRVDFTRVVDVMSSSYASTYSILPVAISGAEVTIATSEPFQTGWEREIEQITKKAVKRVVANPVDVARYTTEFYKLAQQVKGAARAGGAAPLVSSFEQLVELGGKVEANDAHVIHIVDWLLQYAFDQRASDIHLEPRREVGIARFRIDGVLHQVYQVPSGVMGAMTSRIKLLGRMDVVEKRRPQDGRIKTKIASGANAGREVEIRLSTLPTAFGEKLVMRIFDPEVVVRSYAELGFSNDEAKVWEDLIHRPSGIVLVTGPTGSGKTTTLYSTLKQLATDEVNVSTVEDPIEMVDPALNQMQVQHGIDLGFADGLRALMRQDPDIIMVGEIRDKETADMAVQAALTGHLGVLHAAHERRGVVDRAPARARRAELSRQRHADRHPGAAAGADAVPAVQVGGRAGGSGAVEGDRRPVALERAGVRVQAGRLPGVPAHRLHGPDRPDRIAGDDGCVAGADRARRRPHGASLAGSARRTALAAGVGRREDREGRDDRRRSAEGRATVRQLRPRPFGRRDRTRPVTSSAAASPASAPRASSGTSCRPRAGG